jgi:hypothetical protein
VAVSHSVISRDCGNDNQQPRFSIIVPRPDPKTADKIDIPVPRSSRNVGCMHACQVRSQALLAAMYIIIPGRRLLECFLCSADAVSARRSRWMNGRAIAAGSTAACPNKGNEENKKRDVTTG